MANPFLIVLLLSRPLALLAGELEMPEETKSATVKPDRKINKPQIKSKANYEQLEIKGYLNNLNNQDFEKREAATQALVAGGDSAVCAIEKAIIGRDAETRARMLLVLKTQYLAEEKEEETNEAHKLLVKLLKHKEFSRDAQAILDEKFPWKNNERISFDYREELYELYSDAVEASSIENSNRDFYRLIKAYRRASRIPEREHRSHCLYSMAFCYACLDKKKLALHYLDLAVNTFGFDYMDHIVADPDLENIRKEEAYLKLVANHNFSVLYEKAEKLFRNKEYEKASNKYLEASAVPFIEGKHTLVCAKKAISEAAICKLMLKKDKEARELFVRSREAFKDLLKD